jgi:hypothetical protein
LLFIRLLLVIYYPFKPFINTSYQIPTKGYKRFLAEC